MAADDNSNLAAIAYPGFVDILSSVLIMFVFFVLIIASALYFHMIIFKSEMEAAMMDMTVAQSDEASKSQSDLMQENQELREEIENMQQQMDQAAAQPREQKQDQEQDTHLYQQAADLAESKDQKVEQIEGDHSIVIFFGEDSISLTDETEAILFEFIQKNLEDFPAEQSAIDITAGRKSNQFYSAAAQRISLARMLNVRNVFIDHEEASKFEIVPHITGDKEIGGSQHWVRVEFVQK